MWRGRVSPVPLTYPTPYSSPRRREIVCGGVVETRRIRDVTISPEESFLTIARPRVLDRDFC